VVSPPPLPPNAIASLAFLAGHWRGEVDIAVIEEMWLAPSAGVAQGSVRLVQHGKVHTIELIIVAAESHRVVMRYHHFDPDYRAWETDGPIVLTLTSASDSEIIFRNLDRSPRDAEEMGYRLTGPDTLHSWVFAIGADGKATRYSFDYRRVG
jgi:hypothetical protein